MLVFFIIFFFQAEDGIRDYKVTGVQTCALPILVLCLPSPVGFGWSFSLLPQKGTRSGASSHWDPHWHIQRNCNSPPHGLPRPLCLQLPCSQPLPWPLH